MGLQERSVRVMVELILADNNPKRKILSSTAFKVVIKFSSTFFAFGSGKFYGDRIISFEGQKAPRLPNK